MFFLKKKKKKTAMEKYTRGDSWMVAEEYQSLHTTKLILIILEFVHLEIKKVKSSVDIKEMCHVICITFGFFLSLMCTHRVDLFLN